MIVTEKMLVKALHFHPVAFALHRHTSSTKVIHHPAKDRLLRLAIFPTGTVPHLSDILFPFNGIRRYVEVS